MNLLLVTNSSSSREQLCLSVRLDNYQLSQLTPANLLHLDGNLSHIDAMECALLQVNTDTAEELNCIPVIKQLSPNLPIIAIAENWQISNVVKAIKLGADEVCELPGAPGDLDNAIQRLRSSASSLPYHELIPRSILRSLTSEEARILHLLVQGRTTKEVGATLDVSIRTVHYRKKEMLRKLGVQNRSEAIELIRLSTGNLFAGLESGATVL